MCPGARYASEPLFLWGVWEFMRKRTTDLSTSSLVNKPAFRYVRLLRKAEGGDLRIPPFAKNAKDGARRLVAGIEPKSATGMSFAA